MSAQLRAEQAIEDMKKKNPYFEKYATKISKLQQTAPEEYLSRVDKVVDQTKPKETNRTYSELLNPKPSVEETIDANSQNKKLDDIMKIDLIKDKSADEIKHIWNQYHKQKDVISATMTVEQFDRLMERGKDNPIFLLPLPRSEGYEFIMLQFAANTVHFTPLLAYQVHKENAPECLNMIHYTEFRDKGIILMRGEYDHKVINAQEAQCLGNQLQMYYYMNDKSKLNLLKNFTKKPDSFKHMDLIKELEQIELK